VPARPAGSFTGCPERSIFAATKRVVNEFGPYHVVADICRHQFSILPPVNIGGTTTGYRLGPASASVFNVEDDRRSIAMIGDGGFWQDGIGLIVENYCSVRRGRDILPSRVCRR
jgi:indolepyruvate ferredoxin oxidoreductase alpha subunit